MCLIITRLSLGCVATQKVLNYWFITYVHVINKVSTVAIFVATYLQRNKLINCRLMLPNNVIRLSHTPISRSRNITFRLHERTPDEISLSLDIDKKLSKFESLLNAALEIIPAWVILKSWNNHYENGNSAVDTGTTFGDMTCQKYRDKVFVSWCNVLIYIIAICIPPSVPLCG